MQNGLLFIYSIMQFLVESVVLIAHSKNAFSNPAKAYYAIHFNRNIALHNETQLEFNAFYGSHK